MARLPSLRISRPPDAPALPVRDPWPGDPVRGAQLIKGALHCAGGIRVTLRPGCWAELHGAPDPIRTAAHGFVWLRDLRALGTDAARLRARALVADWIAAGAAGVAARPDVAGARIAAWLGHYDFFAASADDGFRQRLMGRLLADARALSAALPAEEIDARVLTALKGLIAAAAALPDHAGFMTRALRFLPQEIERQILPDGCHVERSPFVQLGAVQAMTEMRTLLQAAQVVPPPALTAAIERAAAALRVMRHGDGGLALFNGSHEETAGLIELVLGQAGRGARGPACLPHGGFQRLHAGKTVVMLDCGAPPAAGLDRLAHAGTLSMEMSVGRERLIVNCGAAQAGGAARAAGAASPSWAWHDVLRATAAHSTLVIADLSSSEVRPRGLGRLPEKVEVQRLEANGAHWLEASHDGWRRPFGAVHRRRLYVAETGLDVRGEDCVEAAGGESAAGQPFTVRFHLHPTVSASLQQDGDSVLLRLPSGCFWRLRADCARISLEESVYFGAEAPRRTEQVVLSADPDGPQQVKWAITKFN
jgi:uncharacterized heparinase superfamily protein